MEILTWDLLPAAAKSMNTLEMNNMQKVWATWYLDAPHFTLSKACR
jgi:hypothetical protein